MYILFIGTVILFCINVIITNRRGKITDKQLSELLVDLMMKEFDIVKDKSNSQLTKLFHPKVIELYRQIIANPNCAIVDPFCLKIHNTEIWIVNSVYDRRFYSHKLDTKEQLDKEINQFLSYYDKLLLDKLAKAIKANQDTMVTKLFI